MRFHFNFSSAERHGARRGKIAAMRLFFAKAELLLQSVDGGFVLEMAGKELGRFKKEKKAVSAYNRIRRELEQKEPPREVSDAERKRLLQDYLANSLVGHNAWLEPQKKIAKSRVHHN
jgi:hypothetical protein